MDLDLQRSGVKSDLEYKISKFLVVRSAPKKFVCSFSLLNTNLPISSHMLPVTVSSVYLKKLDETAGQVSARETSPCHDSMTWKAHFTSPMKLLGKERHR